MKTIRLSVLLLLLASAVSLLAQGPVRIAVNDPRPVAAAAVDLEARFGWVITYEDPQWLSASDIVDVTDSVRRDMAGLSPAAKAALPRVLIPRGGSFEFSVTSGRSTDRFDAVRQLLAASALAGTPGSFQLLSSGGSLHIVPLAAKDASGQMALQNPMLDAKITLSEKNWNGVELLEAFCSQLGAVTGQKVELGTFPINTFMHHGGTYSASSEDARDFLSRFLLSIGPGYSWQLFFDPRDHVYALNIHWVGNLSQED